MSGDPSRIIPPGGGAPSLFVYGTLRRGASEHDLLAGARDLGDATWQGRLYRVAHYPGAVPSPDPADAVRGEVYQLPQASAPDLLVRLDRYEGPAYRREQTTVVLRDGTPHDTWIYVYVAATQTLRRIPSGDYLRPEASAGPRG